MTISPETRSTQTSNKAATDADDDAIEELRLLTLTFV